MKQTIVPAGAGQDYDWDLDHVYVKTPTEVAGGRVTVVEDTLKPGFHLARHHHKSMAEIFYILTGEVAFEFDDERITATPGVMVNIPAGIRHDVSSERGATLLTIFSPGGFDNYLSECASLTAVQSTDPEYLAALAERYDIWPD
ncbi:MAG: cupin domain-containing protein [Actinomycetes bacterium]